MPTINAAKVVRRVRKRLEVSQEGLSRLLNASKGAVQHWERGRNNPDLARLNALRQLCPPGPERKELDMLIKQTQTRLAPLPILKPGGPIRKSSQGGRGPAPPSYPSESFILLRRENNKLQRQVTKLEAALQRRNEQVRILKDLASEQQREMAKLRAAGAPAPAAPSVSSASSART
jgi:transcriptional regulator with XRE-family HTH domain